MLFTGLIILMLLLLGVIVQNRITTLQGIEYFKYSIFGGYFLAIFNLIFAVMFNELAFFDGLMGHHLSFETHFRYIALITFMLMTLPVMFLQVRFEDKKVSLWTLALVGLFVLILSVQNFFLYLILIEVLCLLEIMYLIKNKRLTILKNNVYFLLVGLIFAKLIITFETLPEAQLYKLGSGPLFLFIAWYVVRAATPFWTANEIVHHKNFLIHTFQVSKQALLLYGVYYFLPQSFDIDIAFESPLFKVFLAILLFGFICKLYQVRTFPFLVNIARHFSFIICTLVILARGDQDTSDIVLIYFLFNLFLFVGVYASAFRIKKSYYFIDKFLILIVLYLISGAPFSLISSLPGELVFVMTGDGANIWALLMFYIFQGLYFLMCIKVGYEIVESETVKERKPGALRANLTFGLLLLVVFANFNYEMILEISRQVI